MGLHAHIELSHVSVVYRSGSAVTHACKDVTFSVSAGESVALIGPSGCGKSTTLQLAAGLLKPTEGLVTIDGKQLSQPRQETAFIPQDLGLLPWKDALSNAALGLAIRNVARKERDQRARDALAQVGLAEFEHAFPGELSGGMRQRLALARALAMDADLLLMDEPLSAIDALLREDLQEALLDLWQRRGHTQIIVTHSIEEAVFLGERILVFSARPGRIVAEIENPHAGEPDRRASDEFAGCCKSVRVELAKHGAESKELSQ